MPGEGSRRALADRTRPQRRTGMVEQCGVGGVSGPITAGGAETSAAPGLVDSCRSMLGGHPGILSLSAARARDGARGSVFLSGAGEHRISRGDYPTVSPDGDSIAFHARATGQKNHQIWLLRLSTGQANPIPGTEDA